MPRITFEEKYVKGSIFDVQQVKLAKDEAARFIPLDSGPTAEFVHYIQNGGPGEERRGRNYVCLGNFDVLQKVGEDKVNCPACARAEKDGPVSPAKLAMVLPVGRYRTSLRGKMLEPYSLSFEVLKLNQEKFGKITRIVESMYADLAAEAQEAGKPKPARPDLRTIDFTATCTNDKFQNMDFTAERRCYAANDAGCKAQYKEFRSSLPSDADLERLLGQRINADALRQLVGDLTPRLTDAEYEDQADAILSSLDGLGSIGGVGKVDGAIHIDTDLPQVGESVDFDSLLDD